MPGAADILALAGTSAVVLPALLRALRTRDGTGISRGSTLTQIVSGSLWATYTYQRNLTTALISSLLFLTLAASLHTLAVAKGGREDSRKPAAALAAVGTVAFAAGGAPLLAILLGTAPLIAESQQIRALMSRDAPAPSEASYPANILRAAARPPYAIINADTATGLWALCVTTTSATILVLLRVRRSEQEHDQQKRERA